MFNTRPKILVVDDEPEITNALKDFLCRKGYEASGVFSGEEALSALEKERADLILLDMKLPGIQGSEVARMVKEKYPSVKIIVVTAYAGEGQGLYEENILAGLLLKPVRLNELYNKLLETLNSKEAPILNLKARQGIMARVLLIKAKILFLDASSEVFNFLSPHFQTLAQKGENYQLEVAETEEEAIEKSIVFQPDIFLVNVTFLQKYTNSMLSNMLSSESFPKEVILYHITDIEDLSKVELERLTRAVETACLKNGLMEIKWVEI